VEACTKYVRKKWLTCRSEEGEPFDGGGQLLCFRRLSPFFKHVQMGFQDLLKVRPSSLFVLCRLISNSMAFLMSQPMYPGFAEVLYLIV